MIQAINFDDFNINSYGGGGENQFGNFNSLMLSSGGGGGGGYSFEPTPIIATPANRTFQVTSNITGAQIYINGINSFKTTSENITFTKSELLSGDKVITLVKEGYSNNEKYVISVENPSGATIINRPFLNIFNLPDLSGLSQPFGISNTVIRVKHYINEVEQSSNDSETVTSTTQNLAFNLTQQPIVNETVLYNFTVNVNGAGNSVRVIKNGSV